MEILAQDLRFAIRTLRKSPAFAAAVILTLGLGIGANTAIFSLIDAIILRTLPVRNPGQLFFLEAVGPRGTRESFSPEIFEEVRDHNQSMSGVFAFDTIRLKATVDGRPEVVWGMSVSGNFFDLLGVRPARGRALSVADDAKDSAPAAVISHRYWQRRFALDPTIVGRTVFLKGMPFALVGVAPEGFSG